MKLKSSFVLDENDNKIAQLFADLGMSKNLAKTLMYISQVDECCSSEMEKALDLRQPEVSLVMQEIRRRRWAKKHDIKREGKGRPVHVYEPTMHLPEILKAFEQEKLKEVEKIKRDISELRNIIKNR
jgi:predicted transcriptional regulator